MDRPDRYDKAQWLGDGLSGGSYTGGPFKVVLHTTETNGVPGYSYGRHAPHLTYHPGSRRWYQHVSLNEAARALRNGDDPVETNRDSALQVEIVAYSDPVLADQRDGLWIGDLSDMAVRDLYDFLLWANEHFGVQLKWRGKQADTAADIWQPGYKMTPAEWDTFNGVCSHSEVPDNNTHWDTGLFPWNKLDILKEQMEGIDVDQMPTLKLYDGYRSHGRMHLRLAVKRLQALLAVSGIKAGNTFDRNCAPDGLFGPGTEKAVRTFQDRHGLTVDGVVGVETWRELIGVE